MSDLIKSVYMGNFSEPEEMNITCMKATHTGTTDRGFGLQSKPHPIFQMN
jgi:hypothetical protein